MSTSGKKRKFEGVSKSGSESSKDSGSSLSDKDKVSGDEVETVDEFVIVIDPFDKEPVEIRLSADGTLPVSSIYNAFGGSYALKYLNPDTGTKRVVSIDENKTFETPDGGWKGKVFEVIYRPKPPVVDVAPINSSPCRIESPFKVNNVVQNPPPKLKALSRFLFYILRDDNQKLCVTAVTKYFFVTYRHGSNLKHKLETTIKIYRHDSEPDSEQFFTATVKSISQKHDFILLKSTKPINDSVPYYCDPPYKGRHICMYGYGNDFNKLTHGGGYIHSDELQSFKNKDGEITGPFLLMHVGSDYGDSGASVWCSAGLIGLYLGRIGFSYPPGSVTVTTGMVEKAATYTKRNYVVTIERIMDSIKEVEAKENPEGLDIVEPMVINVPGVGDFSQIKI